MTARTTALSITILALLAFPPHPSCRWRRVVRLDRGSGRRLDRRRPFGDSFRGPSIYLFGKGTADKKIYMAKGKADGSGFGGWSEIPGGGFTDVALASAPLGKSLYLFGKGAGDQKVYVNRLDSGKWSGWTEVPGGGKTDGRAGHGGGRRQALPLRQRRRRPEGLRQHLERIGLVGLDRSPRWRRDRYRAGRHRVRRQDRALRQRRRRQNLRRQLERQRLVGLVRSPRQWQNRRRPRGRGDRRQDLPLRQRRRRQGGLRQPLRRQGLGRLDRASRQRRHHAPVAAVAKARWCSSPRRGRQQGLRQRRDALSRPRRPSLAYFSIRGAHALSLAPQGSTTIPSPAPRVHFGSGNGRCCPRTRTRAGRSGMLVGGSAVAEKLRDGRRGPRLSAGSRCRGRTRLRRRGAARRTARSAVALAFAEGRHHQPLGGQLGIRGGAIRHQRRPSAVFPAGSQHGPRARQAAAMQDHAIGPRSRRAPSRSRNRLFGRC